MEALFFTVLGIAIGALSSHATLGNKVTRALTLLETQQRDMETLQKDVKALQASPHFHRRSTDVIDA